MPVGRGLKLSLAKTQRGAEKSASNGSPASNGGKHLARKRKDTDVFSVTMTRLKVRLLEVDSQALL
ncbi:hypothetical protein RSAG8_09007, partial [Rhizoctonia solani AG-8 WAC10335]